MRELFWTPERRAILWEAWGDGIPGTRKQIVPIIYARTAVATGATLRQTTNACQCARMGTRCAAKARLTPELEDAIRRLHRAGYGTLEIATILDDHEVRNAKGQPVNEQLISRVLYHFWEKP